MSQRLMSLLHESFVLDKIQDKHVKIVLSSSENTALASSPRSVISFVSQREYKLKLILIGSYRALKCHGAFYIISFLCFL